MGRRESTGIPFEMGTDECEGKFASHLTTTMIATFIQVVVL
jgi:hypothetical protein